MSKIQKSLNPLFIFSNNFLNHEAALVDPRFWFWENQGVTARKALAQRFAVPLPVPKGGGPMGSAGKPQKIFKFSNVDIECPLKISKDFHSNFKFLGVLYSLDKFWTFKDKPLKLHFRLKSLKNLMYYILNKILAKITIGEGKSTQRISR